MVEQKHLSDEIFDRYAARAADAAEVLRVQTHVAACDACRRKLRRAASAEKAFAAVHQNFAFDEFGDEPQHLVYEQLEFFVDGKMDAVDREIAESHLAFCVECKGNLEDLQTYRQIAAAAAPVALNETVEMPRASFRRKLFAFGAFGTMAPVAAVALLAVAFGAWLLLRDKNGGEIARGNDDQNSARSNLKMSNASPAANVAPENAPSPESAPSETVPESAPLYALNDGQLKVDGKGAVPGAENLSPAARWLVKQSLQAGKVAVADHSLGGGGGVLMSGGGSETGVPFGLETPIGKVVRENRPLLRWKPASDAASYSVAIVDEKFNVVAESGKLTATRWQPSKPLPRGANYSWQVTAMSKDGTETVSPSSPAPPARFRVVEQNLFDDINRLEKSGAPSQLALGVLYARAGMRREARAAFEKLAKENPRSGIARRLLQSVK